MDRTKCFICHHVFSEDEIRWSAPFIETLCNDCHKDYLSPALNEEEKQLRKHPI